MSKRRPETEEQEQLVPLHLADLLHVLEWRTESLGLALVIAESILVYLVAGLLMPAVDTGDVVPFAVILVVMVVAHFVSRILELGRVWSPDYEIIAGAGIVLSLLFAIKFANMPTIAIYDPRWLLEAINSLAFFESADVRPVWGSVVLVAFAWWRARMREEPSVDSAFTLFRWGTIALTIILILILLGAGEDAQIRDRLSQATLGYFIAALSAIGFSRLRLEGARTSSPLGATWLATFAVPILGIGLLAVIGAGIFSRRFLDTTLWLFGPVLWVLGVVFQILILIVAILAFIILTPVFWLIGDRDVVDSFGVTPNEGLDESQEPEQIGEILTVPDPLRYVIAALVLFLVFSLLMKFIYRRRARRRNATAEERESVLDWNDLLGSMGDKLRSIFTRPKQDDPFAGLRGDDRWRHTISIREQYMRLQRQGHEVGHPRRESETAEEYRRRFGRIVDAEGGRGALDAMTTLYRRVRYSGVPATETEANDMRAHSRDLDKIRPPADTS